MDFLSTINVLAKVFLTIHITAGFCALTTFWIPIFTRKGGFNHRKIGVWYVNCMWVVVVSAILLSLKNLIIGEYIGAIFLGFLALITAKPLWKGVAILDNKKEMSSNANQLDLVLNMAIILGGIGLLATGYYIKEHSMSIVLIIFGILGLTSISDLINQLRKQKLKWMKEHIAAMCTSGIAAHTAFLVFGANSLIQNLFSNSLVWIPWVLPSVIGTIGINWAVRKYQPR